MASKIFLLNWPSTDFSKKVFLKVSRVPIWLHYCFAAIYALFMNETETAVWPDLVKFRHFGKIFKVLGNFVGFIYYLAKMWNYFGKFCVPLGKFTFM